MAEAHDLPVDRDQAGRLGEGEVVGAARVAVDERRGLEGAAQVRAFVEGGEQEQQPRLRRKLRRAPLCARRTRAPGDP